MSTTKRLLLALALGSLALFGAGCSTKERDQNQMPWSQPSSWEGRIPGMGG